MDEQSNYVDKILATIKNNKILAVIIVFGLVVIGVAKFTGALHSILSDLNEIYVGVQAKRVSFSGNVYDEQLAPLQGVKVSIAGESDTTDQDGKFDIDLPADLPEEKSFATFVKEGYVTVADKKVEPGANKMDLTMKKISSDQ